jgi:hypothetical protein
VACAWLVWVKKGGGQVSVWSTAVLGQDLSGAKDVS